MCVKKKKVTSLYSIGTADLTKDNFGGIIVAWEYMNSHFMDLSHVPKIFIYDLFIVHNGSYRLNFALGGMTHHEMWKFKKKHEALETKQNKQIEHI